MDDVVNEALAKLTSSHPVIDSIFQMGGGGNHGNNTRKGQLSETPSSIDTIKYSPSVVSVSIKDSKVPGIYMPTTFASVTTNSPMGTKTTVSKKQITQSVSKGLLQVSIATNKLEYDSLI